MQKDKILIRRNEARDDSQIGPMKKCKNDINKRHECKNKNKK